MKNNVMRRRFIKGIEFFIYFVCGVLIFYSVTPWNAAGQAIGGSIVSLPLFRLLEQIPLIGLLFSLLAWVLPSAMAVFLWAVVQLVEITPVLLHDQEILKATIAQLKTVQEGSQDTSTMAGKYGKKLAEYFATLIKNIKMYAAIAYVAEVTVNLWYYLPYGNGWNDFINDFGVWNAELIKWGDFFLMLGSIGVVELLVLFMITVYRFFHVIAPRTEKFAGAPNGNPNPANRAPNGNPNPANRAPNGNPNPANRAP